MYAWPHSTHILMLIMLSTTSHYCSASQDSTGTTATNTQALDALNTATNPINNLITTLSDALGSENINNLGMAVNSATAAANDLTNAFTDLPTALSTATEAQAALTNALAACKKSGDLETLKKVLSQNTFSQRSISAVENTMINTCSTYPTPSSDEDPQAIASNLCDILDGLLENARLISPSNITQTSTTLRDAINKAQALNTVSSAITKTISLAGPKKSSGSMHKTPAPQQQNKKRKKTQ